MKYDVNDLKCGRSGCSVLGLFTTLLIVEAYRYLVGLRPASLLSLPLFTSTYLFMCTTGCGRNNSHILKVNKNQTKQGTQKNILFIKSTYDAIFFFKYF